MGYRIKSVAEMVGVPRNTLLAWERRYGLVQPRRRSNGYREYTADDVRLLRELKALIDAGHRVGEAVSLLQDKATRAAEAEAQRKAEGAPRGGSLERQAERLREALLAYDRETAEELARTLEMRPYRERIEEVYFPALRDVGELWARGDISISQEHFASAWCREKMMAMLMALGHGPENGPVAVCAGFPEERHELGLLAVAVHLALLGYRISWLGADIPANDLAQAIRQEGPAMVAVSALQPRPIAEFERYANILRSAAPAGTRVVVGGKGLPHQGLPELAGVEWVHELRHLRA